MIQEGQYFTAANLISQNSTILKASAMRYIFPESHCGLTFPEDPDALLCKDLLAALK